MLRAPNKPSPTAKLIEDLAGKIEEDRRFLPAVAFMFSYQRYASARNILKQIQGTTATYPIGALRLLELLVRRRPRRKYIRTILRSLVKISRAQQEAPLRDENECNRVKLSLIAVYSRRSGYRRPAIASPRPKKDAAVPAPQLIPQPAFRLFSFSPQKIAQQLTAIEFELFKSVNLEDFCNKRWESDKKTALRELIARSDRLSTWVASHILLQKFAPGQIYVIEKFIEVANFCEKLGNFHAVAGILGGFSLWCISRLTRSWRLRQGHKLLYGHMNALHAVMCAQKLTERSYRAALSARKASGEPAIPHIGVILKDITFIDDGNADVLPDGSPNVTKIAQLADVLSVVAHFQDNSKLEIKEGDPQLTHRLHALPAKSMVWLDERSVGIRPRAGQTAEETSFDSSVEDTTDALSRSDSQLNIEELNTDERGSASETKSDKR